MASQGLKLRDLVDSQQQSDTAPARIYWPIQAPDVTIVDLVNLQTPIKEPDGLLTSFSDLMLRTHPDTLWLQME
jgi:hypothetical protein